MANSNSTFKSESSRCKYRMGCPGYIEGLCFNMNFKANDDWCKFHEEGRTCPTERPRMKYTSVKRGVKKV